MPQDPFAAYRVKAATVEPSGADPFATFRVKPTAPSGRPAAAEDFMTPQDIANRDMTALDLGIGAAKAVGRSVVGLSKLAAMPGALIGGQGAEHPYFKRADEFLQSSNAAQDVGGYMETAAELAVPVTRVARALPAAIKAASAASGPAVRMAGGAALDVATGHPFRGAGKVLGFILDAAKPAAKAAPGARLVPGRSINTAMADALAELRTSRAMPSVELPPSAELPPGYTPRTALPPAVASPARPAAPAPAAPPAGRLVPAKAVPIEEEIAAALADAPTPMPRVTTPPAPQLPAGYTPRTSAPKLRAVPPPAPAAEPKRAYFLKPQEELAAVADDIEPGPLTPDALPASWQQHIGQDLFPLTGKEGEAVAAELVSELRARGLSVGDAMMAVSKNPDVPVQIRQQLLKSLSRVKVQ